MNVELLTEKGVDYDGGLTRFMDNASLYEGLLKQFIAKNEYGFASRAYEQGDFKMLYVYLHPLRELTQNLGIVDLYEKTSSVLYEMKKENPDNLDELLKAMLDEYTRIEQVIKDAM